MKYILIILTTLLFGTSPTESKKIKKEIREFDVETLTNGTTIQKLRNTTIFSVDGQAISETESCSDSVCCHYNKSFRLHKNKNEYWYKNKKLILRVFRTCDSLPSYKDFHNYKFDNKRRLIETIESTYNFQTKNEKYDNGKWVPAKIGDSTLTETNIHQYTYNEFDSIKEEKIIIRSKFDKAEKSWTVKYTYDQDRRLIGKEHPPYGRMKLKAEWFYDKKGRMTMMESSLTGEKIIVKFTYDEKGRVSSQKNGNLTTQFQYDSNDRLLIESTIGNRFKDTKTSYYYNEFGDIIKVEVSYNNEPPFVKVYEYVYY